MPESPFTALLFGLTGCLVDHGARTLPIALQHSGLSDPDHFDGKDRHLSFHAG